MNVLYLHTHDTGRYLDPADSPVPLPGVESLAREAVVFRNAFCVAPTCSPSRSALLTGSYPHENGMVGLAHRGFALQSYSSHPARVLGRAGFETALCGVQHVARNRRDIGYERILDETDDYFDAGAGDVRRTRPWEWDRTNGDRAVSFLREPRERPLFLSLGLFSTHRPFPDPPAGTPARLFHRPPPPVPDTPDTRRDMEGFLASLRAADEAIGRVVAALRETGMWDHSVVLLTTDHGPAFPGMKCTVSDAGTAVSVILRVPGIADDGRVEDALVSQIDLCPTLCELAGVQVPAGVRGHSLLPLLRGERSSIRDAVFSEINYHAAYEPARAVRTQRYRLVRHYGESSSPLPVNVDDSPAKELLRSAGYFNAPREREQLFDLLLDPLEQVSVSGDGRHAETHRMLADMLDRWMTDTNDPLLHGNVPRPAGSRVNRADAWSPTEDTYE